MRLMLVQVMEALREVVLEEVAAQMEEARVQRQNPLQDRPVGHREPQR